MERGSPHVAYTPSNASRVHIKHNRERESDRSHTHQFNKKRKPSILRYSVILLRGDSGSQQQQDEYSRMDAAAASLLSILISHLSCVTWLCIYMEIQLVAV